MIYHVVAAVFLGLCRGGVGVCFYLLVVQYDSAVVADQIDGICKLSF